MTKKPRKSKQVDQARVDEANAAHEREEQSRLDSLRSSKDVFKDKMMSWTKGASPLSFWLTPSAFANFMLGNRDTFFFPHQEKPQGDVQVLRGVAKVGDLIRIRTNPIDPVRQEETRSTDMALVARITRIYDGILGDPPSAEVAETFKAIHGIDLTSEAVWSCEVEVADHSVVVLLDNKSPLILALLNVTGNLRDLHKSIEMVAMLTRTAIKQVLDHRFLPFDQDNILKVLVEVAKNMVAQPEDERSFDALDDEAFGSRIETGPVQFGDDWPGIFLRGDNAMAAAIYLETLLDSLEPDPKSFVDAPMLRSFVKLLQSCQTPCPQALMLKAAKDCLL